MWQISLAWIIFIIFYIILLNLYLVMYIFVVENVLSTIIVSDTLHLVFTSVDGLKFGINVINFSVLIM